MLEIGYTGLHVMHFNDEARKIGSGRRHVKVTVSRKWVKLECAATGAKVKMKHAEFNAIIKSRCNRAGFMEVVKDRKLLFE